MTGVPFLLILVIVVTEMASDLYAPGLPSLQHYFSTSESMVQATLSFNLLGVALSGPIYGVISDFFGRRRVMLWGLFVFCLGSCGSALSSTMSSLFLWRFIQGFGSGVSYVVGLAIIKDRYKGEKCGAALSQITLVTAFSPAIAPVMGAYVLDWFGWQANFWLIASLSCIVFMSLFVYLPETLHPFRKNRFSWVRLRARYYRAFTHPHFMGNSLISASISSAIWALFAAAPFILIEQEKISVLSFSYYGMVGVLSYAAGAFMNHWFFPLCGVRHLLAWGLGLCGVGAMVFLGIALMKTSLLVGIYVGTIILDFGSALVFSAAVTEALDPLPQQSGMAASILGAIDVGLSSLVIFILGFCNDQSLLSTAVVVFICCSLACGLYLWLYIFSPYSSQTPDSRDIRLKKAS